VRRIVLITARDIVKRNEAERLDWKTRGISGIVSAVHGDQVVLELRTPQGVQTATVIVNAKTKVRRYAPDSVRFADASASSTAEISRATSCRRAGIRLRRRWRQGRGLGTFPSPNSAPLRP
jgi:hypothetical protein